MLAILLPLLLLAQGTPENYLLVDSAELEAAKAKAAQFPWARTAMIELIGRAEKAVNTPLEVPDRGGQWGHWYSCKLDGVRLRTISPTEHRCPVCGKTYSGEPYDAVVISSVHSRNGAAIRDCGLAYRLSGRQEFAARAAELLKAYAARYQTYALHNINGEAKVGGGRIMAQTLDESVWLIPVAWGYALVRETLSEADRGQIEQDLFVAAADVIRQHQMGIHNIQCWKNSAVGLAGYVSGRADLVREAIDDPVRGFKAQIAKGITADGLWHEGSLGYHVYTMSATWPLAEAARHRGLDLYSPQYGTMWDAPLALALPNGDAPGFNDNAGANVGTLGSLYEVAFARWKTPAYGGVVARSARDDINALLYGVPEVPRVPLIPTTSALLKDAGYALLRAGTNAAAMRFGMQGGGHGHPDKLNLVTFGKGTLLGLDPGSINYGVPLHGEWYRSTIAHNTVCVDQQLQAAKDGKLEDWQTHGGATTIAASANQAYPGVRLKRTVTLSPQGVIEDQFECASAAAHVYDWAFHVAGTLDSSLTFADRTGTLGGTNGYQHIKELASAQTSEPFWMRWQAGDTTLTLYFKAAPDTEVIRGVAPGRNPADKVPVVIVRRKAQTTTFDVRHEIK